MSEQQDTGGPALPTVRYENWRVEVAVPPMWRGHDEDVNDMTKRCEQRRQEILRHVDGVNKNDVTIEVDKREVCPFCDSTWELMPEGYPDVGYPACCPKAQDAYAAMLAERKREKD